MKCSFAIILSLISPQSVVYQLVPRHKKQNFLQAVNAAPYQVPVQISPIVSELKI